MEKSRPLIALAILAVLLSLPAGYFALKLDQLNDEEREVYATANINARTIVKGLPDDFLLLGDLGNKLEEYNCNVSLLKSEEPEYYMFILSNLRHTGEKLDYLSGYLLIMYKLKPNPSLKELEEALNIYSMYYLILANKMMKHAILETPMNCSMLPTQELVNEIVENMKSIHELTDLGEVDKNISAKTYELAIKISS